MKNTKRWLVVVSIVAMAYFFTSNSFAMMGGNKGISTHTNGYDQSRRGHINNDHRDSFGSRDYNDNYRRGNNHRGNKSRWLNNNYSHNNHINNYSRRHNGSRYYDYRDRDDHYNGDSLYFDPNNSFDSGR